MKKTCTNCNIEKHIDEYHARKGGLYGRHAECKICMCKRIAEKEKEWDECKKQNRRDGEKHRRKCVKFVIDYARNIGEKSLDLQHFEKYRKHCSDFIKRKCRLFLNSAVQRGWIIKPEKCPCCGKSGIIHGHHKDYSEPLVVEWICPKCHGKYPRKKREN